MDGMGWGRGVQFCRGVSARSFRYCKNPALTSWTEERRAVGPGTARFEQSFRKTSLKRLLDYFRA